MKVLDSIFDEAEIYPDAKTKDIFRKKIENGLASPDLVIPMPGFNIELFAKEKSELVYPLSESDKMDSGIVSWVESQRINYTVGFQSGMETGVSMAITAREKDQYPDNEADGSVFCGKCGKSKDI